MWNIRLIAKPFYSTKKILTLLGVGLLFFTMNANAQNSTSSPYSYYGLGELNENGNGNSISMGGTSLAYRGGGVLNLNNPASLAHVDSLKFIFNVGMAAKYTNMNQGSDSDFFNDYNLTRIAFGFKVSSRYSTAFSISPFSSLGYNISKLEKVNGASNYMNRSLKGTGGLNQLIWSNGVKVTKNLSLGINGIYVFGNNTRDEVIQLVNSSDYIYRSSSELISSGLYFNVGAQYEMNFNDYKFILGAKYQPQIAVSAKEKIKASISGIPRHEDEDKGAFDVPESFGLGFGVNKGQQLWFGADYSHEKWSETQVFNKDNDLSDRDKLSFGIEYNANDGYARKFLKKMTYRVGGFYDTGYIKFEDDKISTVGLSFGVGIPMARQTGMINIAFEFGTTGTTKNNLVREDFSRITIDVNLFERWFVKRKYH